MMPTPTIQGGNSAGVQSRKRKRESSFHDTTKKACSSNSARCSSSTSRTPSPSSQHVRRPSSPKHSEQRAVDQGLDWKSLQTRSEKDCTRPSHVSPLMTPSSTTLVATSSVSSGQYKGLLTRTNTSSTTEGSVVKAKNLSPTQSVKMKMDHTQEPEPSPAQTPAPPRTPPRSSPLGPTTRTHSSTRVAGTAILSSTTAAGAFTTALSSSTRLTAAQVTAQLASARKTRSALSKRPSWTSRKKTEEWLDAAEEAEWFDDAERLFSGELLGRVVERAQQGEGEAREEGKGGKSTATAAKSGTSPSTQHAFSSGGRARFPLLRKFSAPNGTTTAADERQRTIFLLDDERNDKASRRKKRRAIKRTASAGTHAMDRSDTGLAYDYDDDDEDNDDATLPESERLLPCSPGKLRMLRTSSEANLRRIQKASEDILKDIPPLRFSDQPQSAVRQKAKMTPSSSIHISPRDDTASARQVRNSPSSPAERQLQSQRSRQVSYQQSQQSPQTQFDLSLKTSIDMPEDDYFWTRKRQERSESPTILASSSALLGACPRNSSHDQLSDREEQLLHRWFLSPTQRKSANDRNG